MLLLLSSPTVRSHSLPCCPYFPTLSYQPIHPPQIVDCHIARLQSPLSSPSIRFSYFSSSHTIATQQPIDQSLPCCLSYLLLDPHQPFYGGFTVLPLQHNRINRREPPYCPAY